ncbi:indole-3-glycerol phosphate synthase TrpC [Bacillus sp. 1P06AnD]|uniref:indole-3-glycerol phosphate synthase TrpC n=1 Tax=Bacillus sp. 1P06AnD TaxID=3132208 RepID=UPI0039A1A417
MSILKDILKEKESFIQLLKAEEISPSTRKPVSLRQSLKAKSPIGIIAELKRHSPSKGHLNDQVNPAAQAKVYEQSGAAAISVLTDEPFFKGSFTDLEEVRKAVELPILCKDFIIDPVQIHKARSAGADAILLIVAALPPEKLCSLYEEARLLGLEVLVEVHDEVEMKAALDVGADLIGINNRNLATFEVTLETTVRCIPSEHPDDVLFISESGMRTREDVEKVQLAGAAGILVGETLMKSANIPATMFDLSLHGENRPVR